MQTFLNENDSEAWAHIAPLLDAALADLNETDRNAVVLRFFYGKSLGEIGTALDANEDAARMRVNRALEKLRQFFVKRGIASTTATLANCQVECSPECYQSGQCIAFYKPFASDQVFGD